MYGKQYAFINYYHSDHRNAKTNNIILVHSKQTMLTGYQLLTITKLSSSSILTYSNRMIAMTKGRREVDAKRRLPLPRRIPLRSEARHNKVRCCHQLHLVRNVYYCIE